MADYLSFSQPWTYQSATAKKAMVKNKSKQVPHESVSFTSSERQFVSRRPSILTIQ